MLSVLLAIIIAKAFGAHNISWAAFSGYMVMRGHVADSFRRGSLRVLGTAVGAGLALALVPLVRENLLLCVLAGGLIGGITLFGALTRKHSYAWLFTGFTFEMVMLDILQHPHDALMAFAVTRLIEVASGVGACIVISCLSTLTLRQRWPGTRMSMPNPVGWHPNALRHAAQGAVALSLLPLLQSHFGIADLSQGAISILAVMMVPISSVGLSGLMPVSRKLICRITGCLGGTALAFLGLFLAHGNPQLLMLATVVGVIIGRHIENGGHSFAYVGTQFTLAVLVALVPDNYTHVAVEPAVSRLCSILIGMLLLEPVLVAWHFITPWLLAFTHQASIKSVRILDARFKRQSRR
ncbi:MAG: FUSC family protein [Rhizomicrobium sp.]